MEENTKSKNTGVILGIVLAVVIIIMGFFLYKLYSENKTLKENEEKKETITDITNNEDKNKSLTYEEYLNVLDKSHITSSGDDEIDSKEIESAYDIFIKTDTNIKKVIAARLGAQHAGLYFLVVKSDGTVKLIDLEANGTYEVFEPFKEYKVDDIVSLERDNYTFKFKIRLTDGAIKDVEYNAL